MEYPRTFAIATLKHKLHRAKKYIAQISAELAYAGDTIKHYSQLPKLPQDDWNIVRSLKQEWICVTSLETLSLASTPQLIDSAQRLFPHLSEPGKYNVFFIRASDQQILEHPEIFLWGLEERLLNIIENYLGLPVTYLGAVPLRSMTDGRQVSSRLWHRDSEDRNQVKVIVYFNDVSEEDGPFEYLPKSLTPLELCQNYRGGIILDRDMEKWVPRSAWIPCTGKRGTVIFANTSKVFHRGKLPTRSERLAVIYHYVSRKPKFPNFCAASYNREQLQVFKPMLSQRQLECLWQLD